VTAGVDRVDAVLEAATADVVDDDVARDALVRADDGRDQRAGTLRADGAGGVDTLAQRTVVDAVLGLVHDELVAAAGVHVLAAVVGVEVRPATARAAAGRGGAAVAVDREPLAVDAGAVHRRAGGLPGVAAVVRTGVGEVGEALKVVEVDRAID